MGVPLPPALPHGSGHVQQSSIRVKVVAQSHALLEQLGANANAQHEQHTPGPVVAPTDSEREHVAPDPPRSHVAHDMTYREMVEMMGMDDRARFGKVMLDRLEWVNSDDDAFEWDT